MKNKSISPSGSCGENKGKNTENFCSKRNISSPSRQQGGAINSNSEQFRASANNNAPQQIAISSNIPEQFKASFSNKAQQGKASQSNIQKQARAINSNSEQFRASHNNQTGQKKRFFNYNQKQGEAINSNSELHNTLKSQQSASGKFNAETASPLDTYRITSEFSSNPDQLDFDRAAEYDRKKLRKRAKRKYLNNLVVALLAHLGSPLSEDYWESFRCGDIIVQVGNRVRSHFCKHRHCLICNGIRTAILMRKYLPTIQTWHHKEFLTLTVKNPKKEELHLTLNKMHKFFTEIKDSERKANRNLVGLRKLEITYNAQEDTFHPHFHILLKDGSSSRIIEKWLKKFNPDVNPKFLIRLKKEIDLKVKQGRNPKKYIAIDNSLEYVRNELIADPQFQNCKPADDAVCMELFKYITKLSSNSVRDKTISIQALDTIYQAIRGRRIFQTFGFIPHEEVPVPEQQEEMDDNIEMLTYQWEKEMHDWVCYHTGECLSGYQPNTNDLDKHKNIR